MAGGHVDVPGAAEVEVAEAPRRGQRAGAVERQPGVVLAGDDQPRAVQRPGERRARPAEAFGIGRGDEEQGAERSVPRLPGPCGGQAAEAVRDHQRRLGHLPRHRVDALGPGLEVGGRPVRLFDADGAGQLLFEPGLPVPGAAVAAPGDDQGGRAAHRAAPRDAARGAATRASAAPSWGSERRAWTTGSPSAPAIRRVFAASP